MKDRNGVEFTEGCRCTVFDNSSTEANVGDEVIFIGEFLERESNELYADVELPSHDGLTQLFEPEQLEIIGDVR